MSFCRDCQIPTQCPPPLHNLLVCPSGGECPPACQMYEWTEKHNQHKPYSDDGLTYCGWATGRGIVEGCGLAWPCPTVRARAGDQS